MTELELEEGEIYLFDPDGLDADEDQPRQDKNWDIENNAANMAQLHERGRGIKGTGILKPVIIRLPVGALDEYGRIKPGVRPIIVDGEGRVQSARHANKLRPGSVPLVPCIFEDVSPDDAFEIAYYANAHTNPMSPVDDAFALLRIAKRYNIGYDKLAQRTNQTKEYVRNRLKAIGDEDTLPILQERRDALTTVKRINQVEKGEFRDELIQMALKGAPFIDIEDSIAARRQGLTLERYRAEKAVRKAEKAAEREASAAKSYQPHTSRPAITSNKNKASFSPSPTPLPPHEQKEETQTPTLEVRPFLGDALDTLLRSAASARDGLAEAKLSDERRADLAQKAIQLRDIAQELIEILDRVLVSA